MPKPTARTTSWRADSSDQSHPLASPANANPTGAQSRPTADGSSVLRTPPHDDAPSAEPTQHPTWWRSRGAVFVAICAAAVLISIGAVLRAAGRGNSVPPSAVADGAAVTAEVQVLALESATNPLINAGQAVSLSLGAADVRAELPVRCQRLAMAAGRGLCLVRPEGLSARGAYILDATMQPVSSLPGAGLPSRARVSADGRYGAMTVFLWQTHGYADGDYATLTQIIDMTSGKVVDDLESFTVWRDGVRFSNINFNFWGVTFARDSNRFYASLGSGTTTYLVQGDIAAREMRVLRENVECPSLSPDGTRIVFKKRMENGPPAIWRLHMLDLATMTEQPLNDARNVDDQVEWLDDTRILYTPPTAAPEIWVATVDGSEPPRPLVTGAVSPVVVRK